LRLGRNRAHVEHVHWWVSADAAACLSAADAALDYAAIKSRREATMATTDYAFCKGLEYPSIVEASQRVAWTVDDIFANRRFDATRRTVPDSWVGAEHLAFLDDSEQRTLNHIRAFSYAHLLGNYEEFIPVQMSEVAGQDWHDDRPRMRALLRFGEEEMKHQQLFQRTEDVLEASCGHSIGRYFDPDKLRLIAFTKAVLEYPLMSRFLLLTAFEFGTQRHYVESVQAGNGAGSDPLYIDVLKAHWIEESQHVKSDVLEVARLAAGMTPAKISEAFDGVLGLGGLIGETFVGQVEQELATFKTVTGRGLLEGEATALRDALNQSLQAIVAGVSLTHPSFKQVALELSKEGAAKLGIV
jgi:hypothetical protein